MHLRSTSVMELFKDHYKPMRLRGCSELTPQGHTAAINGLERYWLLRDLSRVPPITCEDWTESLTAGYLDYLLVDGKRKKATHNKHLRHLSALWGFGLKLANKIQVHTGEHPGVFRLPLDLAKIDEELDDPECWSQEEFAKLLIAAAESKGYVGDCPACYFWPSIVLMTYNTGVRIDAVMHIASKDLDLVNRWVVVRANTQKDKEGMTVRLQSDICEVLSMMKHERNATVFGDWPYQTRTLTEHFKEILTRSGLPATPKDLWHKLRRTFGTEVAISAGELVAQALLGHSHIRVTRRYLDKKKIAGPNAAELIRAPTIPIQLKLFRPDTAADAG